MPSTIDVLSSGPSGIAVNSYTGTWESGSWASVRNPSILAQVQNYSAVAARGANMYVLQEGSIREFNVAADGVTWLFVDIVGTT